VSDLGSTNKLRDALRVERLKEAGMTQTTTPVAIYNECTVLTVHDGDTVMAAVPGLGKTLGLAAPALVTVRVAHVNAAELDTAEGKRLRTVVRAWTTGKTFTLHVYGREKYGRVLADLIDSTGATLSSVLIGEGAPHLSVAAALAPPG
jgi:endonuclease YncB( thermonuclease family)